MTREVTENEWLRKHVAGKGDFFLRVENVVAEGTFDTFGTILGNAFWIEIKAPVEPARPTTRLFGGSNHEFTQGQKNFALSVGRAGGNCWGFIGTNLRQMLIPGSAIERANHMTVSELLHVAVWSRGKNTDIFPSGRKLRYILANQPYKAPPSTPTDGLR